MITLFDFEAGVKGQIPHLQKLSQTLIPHMLLLHFEGLRTYNKEYIRSLKYDGPISARSNSTLAKDSQDMLFIGCFHIAKLQNE